MTGLWVGKKVRLRLPRHALHAASITFAHPTRRERLTFRAELPEDLRTFLGPGSAATGR